MKIQNIGWYIAILLAIVCICEFKYFESKIDGLNARNESVMQMLVEGNRRNENLLSKLELEKRELQERIVKISVPALTKEESLLEPWIGRVGLLRNKVVELGLGIPELRLLKDEDWLSVTVDNKLETDEDCRVAARKLRERAKNRFGPVLRDAYNKFCEDNAGQMPLNMAQLQKYLPETIDGTILERYQILETGAYNVNVQGRILLIEKVPVDNVNDSQLSLVPGGFSINTGPAEYLSRKADTAQAMADYKKANGGKWPASVYESLPYMKNEKLKIELMERMKKNQKL